MPDYPVPDPKTGKMHIVVSDTPPTPEEMQEILAQLSAPTQDAEPYTDPSPETAPHRGIAGVAPEGVEMYAGAQAVRGGGKLLEKGAQYLTGPVGAGAGGTLGNALGLPILGPFVLSSLGAKFGHLARKPAEALGRGLQHAPGLAPVAGAAGLVNEFSEEDGIDPLDVASLLGLAMTAFPPTTPMGLTLMTGSGLLGGAEQMVKGNTRAGALEMGLSALPFAGKAARAVRMRLPSGAAAPTSAAPAAAGATSSVNIPGAGVSINMTPQAKTAARRTLGVVPPAGGAPTGSGPGILPSNDVVSLIKKAETPDFLNQDVVRWPRPKNVLRSDESVLGLAREVAEKQGTAVPTRLKQYPNPTGSSEAEKALRQRRHIATGERGPKPTQKRKPAKKSEKK